MVKQILLLYVLLLTLNVAFSQSSIKAVYTNTPPKLDGIVNDVEWQNAAVVDNFYQREPNTGQSASEKTVVYILYDKNNIYFGFKCYLDPKDVTAKEMARDVSLGQDDRVQVILDTFLDHRNAYWFQVGPRGSIGDALVSQNGAAFNKQWDGLWDGRGKIQADGWHCELVIPFKTMNFRAGQTTWGLKLIRYVKKREEMDVWPQANLDAYKFQVSNAGLLEGMEGITQGIGLDISPYGLAGLDQKVGEDSEFPTDAGVDVFYQVTPGLKSALTVNTDFAQTEVDARQINLTRFKLHFPEKRDFFLDGSNYFQFGIQGDDGNNYAQRIIPFFSRQMGLDGNGNPVPIVWGGKVTGQVGEYNLGIMNIMDEREGGNENFAVGRVTRNFGSQSSLGVIGTIGNAMGDVDNSVFGVDLKLATSTFQKNKNLALILFGLNSYTSDVSGNDRAFGGEFVLPNDFFSLRLGHHQIEENFKAGIGFVPRLGIKETYFQTGVGPRPNKYGLMQVQVKVGVDYITDVSNVLLTRDIAFTPFNLRFLTGDQFTVSTGPQYELLREDFVIHPDHTIPAAIYDFWRNQVTFVSAQRRNFWASTGLEWGDFYSGDRTTTEFAFGYKINVPVFVGLEFEHNDVNLPTGGFTTDIYRWNVNLLFSPKITLYTYIQYDNLSKQMGWQSRFAWILTPGNEVMLTWNSQWNDPLENYEVTESATRLKIRYNYRF